MEFLLLIQRHGVRVDPRKYVQKVLVGEIEEDINAEFVLKESLSFGLRHCGIGLPRLLLVVRPGNREISVDELQNRPQPLLSIHDHPHRTGAFQPLTNENLRDWATPDDGIDEVGLGLLGPDRASLEIGAQFEKVMASGLPPPGIVELWESLVAEARRLAKLYRTKGGYSSAAKVWCVVFRKKLDAAQQCSPPEKAAI